MADARPRPPAFAALDPERIDGPRSRSISFDSLAPAQPAPAHAPPAHPPFEVEDVDPPVDFEPIARTKITPAPVRPDTLHRGRLLDWLERRTRRRLSFVIANAGYGKTTLLADFTERTDQRCLWFRLDPTDGDWVTFLNYLTAAFQAVDPGFGRATYSLFSQVPVAKPTLQAAIAAFMADVSSLPDEPLILILDDYHVVDEAPDVAGIIGRLLREAPPAMHFVIASRREPELPTARLRAHGDVAMIDSTDLRFTRDELETLFADGFGQPLEADLLDMLDRRTEGWAACIQLLQSTLREMRAVEVRRFIEHLSVTEGPVYEYLAQEVLREARPDMRAFLVRSSILDPVVPAYAVAAMAEVAPPPSDADIRDLIRRAYEVGLLSRRDVSSGTFRFHPLLREFLESQLRVEASPADVAAAHRRVARLAEPDDWLTACRHYLAAGDQATSVRLLDRSVLTAVGTGAWGQAAALVADLGGAADAPDVQVIVAMDEIESGRLVEATARLEAIDRAALGPQARALVRHGLLRAYWMQGVLSAGAVLVEEVLKDAEAPQLFKGLARAHRFISTPDGNQDLELMIENLESMAAQHEDADLQFFAGVSHFNLALARYQHGDYSKAITAAERALELFERTDRQSEVPATAAILAVCSAELSRRTEAAEYVEMAVANDAHHDPDAVAQVAYLALITGDSRSAEMLGMLTRLRGSKRDSPAAQTESELVIDYARAVAPDVVPYTARAPRAPTVGIGAFVHSLSVQAISAVAAGVSEEAVGAVSDAIEAATASSNRHWLARLHVLSACLVGDASRLRRAITGAAGLGDLALLDIANALAAHMQLLQPLPQELRASIEAFPDRWLPALRRKVAEGYGPSGLAAARLLDEFGSSRDIPLLRAFDRTYLKSSRASGLGRDLIQRTSPTVRIQDLGRGYIEVVGRVSTFGSMRRRASGLLCYLASRPSRSATREQIMEDLWSDLVPSSAANSLNQTLYFLRREFDPFFDDDASYEYISHSGELVWLDSSKVEIASDEFAKRARDALAVVDREPDIVAYVLERYTGRFAVEFEYEEWSLAWRDYLHSTYLHLAQALHRAFVARGELGRALAVAQRAIASDPSAIELERALVWTYAAMESTDAAGTQYQHYALTFRELNDTVPPTFAEVTGKLA